MVLTIRVSEHPKMKEDEVNTKKLIAAGYLKPQGEDYLDTVSGITIRRISLSRRTAATAWKRDDESNLYRSLYEAYYKINR